MSPELESVRQRLDEIDRQIVDRLADRQRLVDRVATVKLESGDPVRDQQREEDLLRAVHAHATEAGVDERLITSLFRDILDHSARWQTGRFMAAGAAHDAGTPLRVAYQGSNGAYSEIAAQSHFAAAGRELCCSGFTSFREVLEAVRRGAADYAMLPVENSTAGSIAEAYDLLAATRLAVIGEEILQVQHCLVAIEDTSLANLRRILSHPQALAQCSEFLASLPECAAEAHIDTAIAVERIVRDGDPHQAAIASEHAARLHDLHIIRRGIANQVQNQTRFLVIGRKAMSLDERIPCKTSLVFTTRHRRGALVECLSVLAEHDLNLTKLESRPLPSAPWEYRFYVDFEGNSASPGVGAALRALAPKTRSLKVLGSYSAAARSRPRTALRPTSRSLPRPRPQQRAPMAKVAPAPVTIPPAGNSGHRLVSRVGHPEDTLVVVGGVTFGGPDPVLIGGPCSVESRQQVMDCALAVKAAGGHVLRGGCFKPRTSPYSFQGLGYEGLELLVEAGCIAGLPVITEVLQPADVHRVAEYADILQVGARNMQNFPLLKEVGTVERPVLLKRGMMGSIDEWLAAAEYILAHGNHDVVLCERGIRTFETATRGTLDLTAIPVVRERTHLPVIVDPSHAAGERRWVAALARAALAASAHGVMVEMHPDPDAALSDGSQSLTFDQFHALGEELVGGSAAMPMAV